MTTTSPRQYLLVMWEGGGTVPPQLGIARRLIDAGHAVHVLGDPTIGGRAREIGCEFSAWTTAPHRRSLAPEDDIFKDWEASNPISMLRNALDRFMAGPSADFASDTAKVIAEIRPDVALVDGMILGAMIAAQSARIPVAVLMPNIWMLPTKGVPAVGPGFSPAKTGLGRARDAAMRTVANRIFSGGLPALNATRTAYGLAPLHDLWDQVRGVERILVLTSARFDFAADHVPDNVQYVGPVLDDPSWAEPWLSPWPADNEDPLVLVALSSTYQDQVPLLRRIVEAMSTLPVRAVVTLGQMVDPSEVRGAPNVVVVPSAPHAEILPKASLIVTHCGHGTTMKALAAGVPLVCLPMGRDQNDTAARVVHTGAGVRLSPKASATKVGAAVKKLLDDDTFRSRATEMAAVIADELDATDIVADLENLALNGSKGITAASG